MIESRKRITAFLSDAALPTLPPTASLPVGSPQESEPDNIPF
jgi:hypothetical protein